MIVKRIKSSENSIKMLEYLLSLLLYLIEFFCFTFKFVSKFSDYVHLCIVINWLQTHCVTQLGFKCDLNAATRKEKSNNSISVFFIFHNSANEFEDKGLCLGLANLIKLQVDRLRWVKKGSIKFNRLQPIKPKIPCFHLWWWPFTSPNLYIYV